MNVDVSFNVSQVTNNLQSRKQQSIAIGVSELRRLSQPYVRFLTGQTSRSAYRASNLSKGLLIYDTPYAHFTYFNTTNRVTKDKNPNATPKWCDVAWQKYGKNIVSRMEKEFKK